MALTLLDDQQQDKRQLLSSAQSQRDALDSLELAMSFGEAVANTPLKTLSANGITTLQINVGRKCNQTCSHCHVDAGPDRKEEMSDEIVDAVLRLLETERFDVFDITGGAPELHPRFEEMVRKGREVGAKVIDRCNLTILTVQKYANLHTFLAEHQVEVVASLPYHSKDFTDRQRGDGVFEKSIEALKKLNSVGYGMPGTGLVLTLVTNPVGAFLPAPQADLEQQFKRRLKMNYDVEFTNLFCITNLPISRYLEWLQESGNLDGYMNKLVGAFNGSAAEGVMCRNTISVGYEGELFDCDFNQMLELPVHPDYPQTIFDYERALLDERKIVIGPHCFGCTAGQGSSCGGATA